MNTTKRQHYLSRFYLSRFSREDGRVLVHRAGSPPIFIHTKNVGVETHYHSIPGPDDRLDAKPEEVISEYIDRPTARVFKNIDAGAILDVGDQVQLAVFMVFQYYRSPARKQVVKDYFTDQASIHG